MPERDPAPQAETPAAPPTRRQAPGRTGEPSTRVPPAVRIIDPAPPEPARKPRFLLGGFVITALVLAAYAGAILFFRVLAPGRSSDVVLLGAGLSVGVVVFFVHALLDGAGMPERMRQAEDVWRSLLGLVALVAPSFVRWILLSVLASILAVAYQDLYTWDPTSIARLRVLGACAMPAILAICSALLVERRFARGDFRLRVVFPPGMAVRDRVELKEKVERMWSYENELMRESVQRMARHAMIFGFLAASILTACAVILLKYSTIAGELRHLLALSVGSACLVSFTLNLGQILFRSASNDATARMMAWAARTLLIVSVATVFLGVALLSGPEEASAGKGYLFQGFKGALIVGVTVALLGERVLRAVTDRAASMLGVGPSGIALRNDLTLIDGLNEEDLARLAEERVDSVHALAFMPTPRLFFNTTYSLQRICDWQDQAMLIARLGSTNAQMLREQYLVRGGIAARQLAREICASRGPASAALRAGEGAPQTEGQPSLPGESDEDEGAKLRALAKALGFTGVNQAVLGLRSLVDDEGIERLEVFTRSVPVWRDGKNEPREAERPSEPPPPPVRPSPPSEG